MAKPEPKPKPVSGFPTTPEYYKRPTNMSMPNSPLKPKPAPASKPALKIAPPVTQKDNTTVAPKMLAKPVKSKSLEQKVDDYLGNPQTKARDRAGEAKEDKEGDPIDNVRHANAGRYTAEAIRSKVESKLGKNVVGRTVGKAAGLIGANVMGAAHEGSTLISEKRDTRPMYTKLKESAEDIYNNYVGSKIGLSDKTPAEKTRKILEMSRKNQIPDGYGDDDPFRKGKRDAYAKKKRR
jgi:hypothetical protein